MGRARETGAKAVEAFNSHDRERLRKVYAADAVFEAPGDVRLQGARRDCRLRNELVTSVSGWAGHR